MKIITYISKFLNRIRLIGKIRHLYRIKKARKVLNTLKKIQKENPPRYVNAQIITYLRKINPFVFEELILTVIEDSNIRVYRNKKYTGDGGIDGIIKINSDKICIQCKRYQNFINPKDVKELSEKVKSDRFYLGLFVHTGKTGDKSKEILRQEKNILFISGSLLVDLILGKINITHHIKNKCFL